MIKFFKRAERYIWILFGCGFIPILLYYFIFGDESSELDGFNIIGVLAFIGGGAGVLYFIFKFLVKFLLFTGIMRLNEGEEIFGETAEQEELEEPEDEPLVSYTSYTELYDET